MVEIIETFDDFIVSDSDFLNNDVEELTNILKSIKVAAQIVNRELSKLVLTGIGQNKYNIDSQKEILKTIVKETFKGIFTAKTQVCGLLIEINGEIISINKSGKYVVLIDSIDGVSNIDENVSVGTIFSIYHRVSKSGTKIGMSDFLQLGEMQVSSGYIIYGSSTMLVYSNGNGVNGFTYDPEIGLFCLSHPNIRIPSQGYIYSINQGNYGLFPRGVREYVNYCQHLKDYEDKPYQFRYTGSFISDFHRNLLLGGIYMYPEVALSPTGNLQLVSQCNPLAFLVEQAGGLAIDGRNRILDITPSDLNETIPLFIGSKEMVMKLRLFINDL